MGMKEDIHFIRELRDRFDCDCQYPERKTCTHCVATTVLEDASTQLALGATRVMNTLNVHATASG